eukprot:TRINITY_DN24042_c0_g1_i1.p1 TRINITY_DN24042_c0_g1~~TRINITY_DN24042_c0_g1_i1.p1  ORF type:complete len:536 (-),score=75.50 TRINITY_DN24042_c0_g1_i1:15-1622(-)
MPPAGSMPVHGVRRRRSPPEAKYFEDTNFIDIVSKLLESSHASSEHGSTDAARISENPSWASVDHELLSNVTSDYHDAAGFIQERPWLRDRRNDLWMHIKRKIDIEKNKPGQRGHHAALSTIREIPDTVGAAIQRKAPDVVEGIMDEVLVTRDDICRCIVAHKGYVAGENAQLNVTKTVEILPDVIQSKLDVHIADAHRAVACHVDDIVQHLESIRLDHAEFAKTAQIVSEKVQEIVRETVEAAAQESIDDARRRMENAVADSLPESEEMKVHTMHMAHTQMRTELLQATHDVVMDTIEIAKSKMASSTDEVKQGIATSTLANEVVAQTLLRAKAENRTQAENRTLTVDEAIPDAAEVPATELQSNNGMPSRGNIGHPELCARPCIYASRGDCVNGDACGFCHMPHVKRAVHLDKKGRDLLKRMTFEERLQTILPAVRYKVGELKLGDECVEAIDEILASLPPQSDELLKGHRRAMHRVRWTRFTLRSLFTMLKVDAATVPVEFEGALQALLNKLRQSLVSRGVPSGYEAHGDSD